MTEEQQPDQQPPEDSALGDMGEAELDDLLSRATSLASELSGGVGESDTAADEGGVETLEPTGAGDTAQVSTQLDRADALAESAAREIGVPDTQRRSPVADDEEPFELDGIHLPPVASQDDGLGGVVLPAVEHETEGFDGITLPPTGIEPTQSDEPDGIRLPAIQSDAKQPPAPAPSASIPDFMAEFTQPEGEAEAGGATIEPAAIPDEPDPASSPSVPDFMAEFTQPEPEPTVAPEPAAPPEAESGDAVAPPAVPDFMAEFTEPEASSATSGVPDFMSEFTQPEPEATPAPAQPAGQTQAQSIPLDEATLAEIQSGAAGNELSEDQTAEPPVPATQTDGPQAQASSAPTPAPATSKRKPVAVPPVVKKVARMLAPWILKASTIGVRGLELADKPVSFVNNRLRELLGLVALATLGVAVVVFLISLF